MNKPATAILLGFALCVSVPERAAAQSTIPSSWRAPGTIPASELQAYPTTELKSPTVALMCSLLGTVVPLALSAPAAFSESSGPDDGAGPALLFLGGLIVGPSLGHFYAGRPGRAFAGIGIRTGAFLVLGAAFAASWNGDGNEGDALAVLGLGLMTTALVWDIASAPKSARTHNEAAQRTTVALGFLPEAGTPGLGIRAQMTF